MDELEKKHGARDLLSCIAEAARESGFLPELDRVEALGVTNLFQKVKVGTVQVFIPLSVFSEPGCVLSAGDPAMQGPLPEHLGWGRRPAQMSKCYGAAGVSAVETRGRAGGSKGT